MATTNKTTVDLTTTTTNNTEIGRNESTSTSDRTSNLIKKFSIFDEKQAKAVLETVVEVLDLNVDAVDEEEEREHRHEHKIDLNKLENMSISESATSNSPLEKFHCITCDLKLLSRNDQIEHYKGDLHLFNLKQKMKGKPVVSAEEFERLTDISSISGSDDDSDEEKTAGGGLVQSSSSSESDDEVDDEKMKNKQAKSVVGGRNKTKIMFKLSDSSILVLFKCILFPKHELLTSSKEIINRLKSVNSEEKWCIILVAAGHFAAAVFKGDQPILHKTFHRYVVRAKRGTVQSQHDSAGRNARSAGANIRRHQEAAFKDDIRLLIGTEWKSELDKCKCIFIRVPKYNRPVLIASNKQQTNAATTTAPFVRNDPRLRHIPFMTFRPTFNEVKRAHTVLSKLENYNSSYLEFINKFNAAKSPSNKESTIASPSSSTAAAKSLSKTAKSALKASNRAEKEESSEESENEAENDNQEEVEEADNDKDEEKKEVTEEAPKASDFIKSLSGESLKLFNEIYTCCATNNPTRLKQIFDDRVHLNADSSVEAEQQSLLIEALLNKRLNADLGFTLLHLTSQLGFPECVSLLLHNGANPAIADLTKQKRLPYFLCLNKATRDTYRRFMSDFPNRYDYVAAKISSPLTTEKFEKEKEKKRAQRKQKRKRDAEKQKTADKVQKQQEAEEAEKKLFLSLSDQQKRQLIAGRNFFNAVPLNADSPEKPVGIKVISRCWYCAKDMSTHVPFEYFDYKFCSTKCLNSHRQSQGSKT